MTAEPITARERELLSVARKLRGDRDRLRRELRAASDELVTLEGLRDTLAEMRSASVGDVSIKRRERRSGLREGVAVALLSDVHAGEAVDPAKVHGQNEYNLEVCRARVSRYFEGVRWLVENHQRAFNIREVMIGVLGDVVTGHLREEDLETSLLPPTLSTVFARGLLNDGVRFLLDELDVERINLLCVHGNHGRTTQRPRVKTSAENSFEHLMYLHMAEDWRGNERVRFVISAGDSLIVNVYDNLTRWMHGDEIRYRDGIGGITIPLNKAVFRLNKARKCIVTCLGHHHSYLSHPDAVINGSIVGYNEYAQKCTFPFEPPQQAFFILDSRRGKCMSTPIWCDGGGA